jgi:hypothetical protein
MNAETKEQSKQWMHTHSPNKPENFKQILSARRLMVTVLRDRKGVLIVEFTQQVITVTSEEYCESPKLTALGPSEQKPWNTDIRCRAPPWQ